MSAEQPKQYTPEEIARLEKSRTISDAELLKGGAEYIIDENKERVLLVGKSQNEDLIKEHRIEQEEKTTEELCQKIEDFFKSNRVKEGDSISMILKDGHRYFYGDFGGLSSSKGLVVFKTEEYMKQLSFGLGSIPDTTRRKYAFSLRELASVSVSDPNRLNCNVKLDLQEAK